MQGLHPTPSVIPINPKKRAQVKKTDRFFYDQIKPFGLCVSPAKDKDLTKLEAEDFSTLRDLTLKHKVVVLRGFLKLKKDELINLSEQFGEVIEWIFGRVLDLQVHHNPEDQLFTNNKIPFHWDGKCTALVPNFQLHQCLRAPTNGKGGETIFCDTTKVLGKMTKRQIQALKKIDIEYRTDDFDNFGSEVLHQLISSHPESKEDVLRFAEPDEKALNPVFIKVNGLGRKSQNAFLKEFIPKLYQDDVLYEHQWKNNDLLLSDNHALVHGRNEFSQCIDRHLRRVHIL